MVRVFGDEMKLSRITAASQEHLCPHLIINMKRKTNERIPSVNENTDREVNP